jgi:hypothetical protein
MVGIPTSHLICSAPHLRYDYINRSKEAETDILEKLDFIGNQAENGSYRWAAYFEKQLGWSNQLLNPAVRKKLKAGHLYNCTPFEQLLPSLPSCTISE